MTLADEARTLRERVAARLAELEPLVREYQELQRVADEIGLTASEPASATAEEPAAPAAAAPQPAGCGSAVAPGLGSPPAGTSWAEPGGGGRRA